MYSSRMSEVLGRPLIRPLPIGRPGVVEQSDCMLHILNLVERVLQPTTLKLDAGSASWFIIAD